MVRFEKELTDEDLDFDVFTKWKPHEGTEYTWFFAGNSTTRKALLVRRYSGFSPFAIEVEGTAFDNVQAIGNIPSTKEEFIEEVYKAANLISLMGVTLQAHKGKVAS